MMSDREGLSLIGIPRFILRAFNPFSKRANWIERHGSLKSGHRRYFEIGRRRPDARRPALINDACGYF